MIDEAVETVIEAVRSPRFSPPSDIDRIELASDLAELKISLSYRGKRDRRAAIAEEKNSLRKAANAAAALLKVMRRPEIAMGAGLGGLPGPADIERVQLFFEERLLQYKATEEAKQKAINDEQETNVFVRMSLTDRIVGECALVFQKHFQRHAGATKDALSNVDGPFVRFCIAVSKMATFPLSPDTVAKSLISLEKRSSAMRLCADYLAASLKAEDGKELTRK